MKQFFLRVMMCALMVTLWASGARADGKLNSVSFKLTPTGNATCISTYNSAVTSGYGTQSGQLVDNKLTILKSFSTTTTSQPVSVTRDPFFPPSIYPTAQTGPSGDGPPFFPPPLTPTPIPPRRPTYSTTNSFTLALTGNQTINEGDVFVVGPESTAPSAQVTIAKSTRQLQSFGPPVVTSWKAVSGQVRVVSKSASALTLQLTDVVAQGASSSDRTTFNGTITATFNQAPTDIALSNISIVEKQAAGATVGTLSATDADASDTFTYALVAGEGDTDNASFVISGNTLQTAEVFDVATKSSYSIRVRITDKLGATFEKIFAITVTPNQAPTDIALSGTSVLEKQAADTTVGTLSATDADAGDTFTYALVAGDGDSDNSSFAIDGDTLQTSQVFDVATKSSYSIRVRATDAAGATFEKSFVISVIVANRAPVAQNAQLDTSQGTAVSGQLTGTDADGDALTFASASDPAHGNLTLNANGTFSYAPNADFVGTDSFTFTANDGQTSSAPATVTIAVAQGNRAPVLADASFNATQNVAFSQQLAGTDADGDALTYRVTAGTLPFGLMLSEQGLLKGTPIIDGSPVVTVEVADGKGGTGTAQITIVVKAAVVPPTLNPTMLPASPTTNQTVTVTANAVDPKGSALTLLYDFRIKGKSVQSGSSNTLDLSKLGHGDKGDVITCDVTATNAKGVTATASAQVAIVNSVPVAISSKGEVPADTEKAFVLNAYDADGDALTYKRVGGPRNGVTADIRVDPTDGKTKLFYKSRKFYGGVDIIRFVVFDSSNKQSNESTLGINVLYTPPPPANRAPIAGDTFIDTYVGKSEVKGLLGSDPDGDAMTFRIVGNAKYGSSVIKRDTDGQFKLFYTSLNRFYGDDSVTYIVTDSRGKESNLATVGIHFTNRSPVAQGNKIGVASGELVSQYLFADDPDNDAVTLRLVNNPRYGKGEVKLDAQGKWRFYYTSLPGYVGPDQITFIAIDPMGKESQVAAIDINVVRVSSASGALQRAGAAPSGGSS